MKIINLSRTWELHRLTGIPVRDLIAIFKKAAETCVVDDLEKPLTEEEKQELLKEIDNIALEMWKGWFGFQPKTWRD